MVTTSNVLEKQQHVVLFKSSVSNVVKRKQQDW